MQIKAGETIDQHKNLEERLSVARRFSSDLSVNESMVVDDITNACDQAYEARPERIYVVQGGKIVWRSGLGPMQYDVAALQRFLADKAQSNV